MKFKIKTGVSGNILGAGGFEVGVVHSRIAVPFEKGNKLAAAENMTPDAHARRMAALYRGWATKHRRGQGEQVMSVKTKKKISKRRRIRIKENVVREMREVQEIARMHADDAMRVAAEIMTSPASRNSDRLAAAQLVLDRAYGKATQTNVNANVDANGKAPEISSKELDSRIDTALNRIESITGRTAKPPKSEKRPPDIRERDRDPGNPSVH